MRVTGHLRSARFGFLALLLAAGASAQEIDCTGANALLTEGENGFPLARGAEPDEDGFLDWVWNNTSWCKFHDVRSEKFVALDCAWEWDEGQVDACSQNGRIVGAANWAENAERWSTDLGAPAAKSDGIGRCKGS